MGLICQRWIRKAKGFGGATPPKPKTIGEHTNERINNYCDPFDYRIWV
jgi:hypothetical protein